MNDQQNSQNRLALIATLVERSPGQCLGRTALVKLAYLLQVFQHVSLGYSFRLYTYGPFDENILYDLAQAEALQIVDVKVVSNPVGYGYEIRPGSNVEWVKRRASAWLAQHEEAFAWVMQEFGQRSASELELVGTIIYVDQENVKHQRCVSVADLVQRVHKIKTHFAEGVIKARVHELAEKQLLSNLTTEQHISV